MTLQTENLILAQHLPRHLRALLRGPDEFENVAGLCAADGVREQLLSTSQQFLAKLESAKAGDPWEFGFAVIHKIDNVLIGTGGFPGPPNSEGVVEIAYGIAPSHENRGYATEVAKALCDFASRDPRVKKICAHTLAEPNASTRVLEKCGFKKVGDAIDPENNLSVWRWERAVSSRTK
ncbi:MAG TPA: GNAT family N-acetyltransferase [Chthoniobacterales bacterium]|nr:GNAT family N-acetyltransferase [Chthoniobacterales bacterium]